jgi:hypothetical protein
MPNDRLDEANAPSVHGRIQSGSDGADPLDAFPTEAQVAAAVAGRRSRRWMSIVAAVLACLLVGGGVATWLFVPAVRETAHRLLLGTQDGTLAIDTTPPGWDVLEGARTLGTTPLRLSMPPGAHSLVLRSGHSTRPLRVVIAPGTQVFHTIDLRADSVVTGALHVATAPPGALVDVDGERRGPSPVEVANLVPGEHDVAVTSGDRTVTQKVTIAAGQTTALVVPVVRPEAPGGGVGFLAVSAPIDLQVYEGEALVGSSRNQRVMLLPGRRTLRLLNGDLGFERTVTVAIEPGGLARLTVAVPNGSLSVNAVPWAEVVVDGRVIGETPIANFAVPLGSHEVILRNPKFPEQKRTVVVSLATPARLGVDLRQ